MMASSFKENTKPIDSNESVVFIDIGQDNQELISRFLKEVGSSSNSFRYYLKRSLPECIKSHILTTILTEDSLPIAYGHLDKDENGVWLGICVRESHVGKGYGKIMMDRLTSFYDGSILLTADESNHRAISLYEKYGFLTTDHKNGIVYMIRKRL
jgi:ribosomal protein S18 acetylase RimI-like enzyme